MRMQGASYINMFYNGRSSYGRKTSHTEPSLDILCVSTVSRELARILRLRSVTRNVRMGNSGLSRPESRVSSHIDTKENNNLSDVVGLWMPTVINNLPTARSPCHLKHTTSLGFTLPPLMVTSGCKVKSQSLILGSNS